LIKILLLFITIVIYKLFIFEYKSDDYLIRGDHPSVIAIKEHAKRGDARAQYMLGLLNDKGPGVTENDKQALYWYRKSAINGYARAQYVLADKYEKGQVVTINYKRAVYWFRQSAEQGFAMAQNELARRIQIGRGVTADYIEAHKWFNIAIKGGYKVRRKFINELEKNMTPSQISSAQKLAEEWIEKHQYTHIVHPRGHHTPLY